MKKDNKSNKVKIKIVFSGESDMYIKSNEVAMGQVIQAIKGLQQVLEEEIGLPYSIIEMKYDKDHSN